MNEADVDAVPGGDAQSLTGNGKFLQRVLDSLSGFVGILDLDGRLLEANRAPLEAAGLQLDEVRGRKLWDTYWWSHDERVQARLREACARAARGSTVRHDLVARMAGDNRMLFAVQVSPLRDDAGRITHLIPSGVDITARRLVEEDRARTHALLSAVTQTVPDPLFAKDRGGRMLLANPATLRAIGKTAQEVMGKNEAEWLDDTEQAAAIMANDRRIMDSGRPERVEEWLTREDGPRLFSGSKAPLRDDAGEVIGLVGISRDITEQRRAQEQLRESGRRKDEFLAMLGHELRNPLAAIRTASELVNLAATDDPRLRRAYDVIARQSNHMGRLIDGLLEVSRIARGKIQLEKRPVDLAEVLRAVVEDRRDQLEARGLTLERDGQAQGLWVDADPVRMAQIFDNLLGNAIKFTEPPGPITVIATQDDEDAVVRIRDTGLGIRSEMLTRIFEPFQQTSDAVALAAGGLGLGLALVKGLVELHDGQVDARSRGPGTGAEFVVRIPQVRPPGHHPIRAPTDGAAPRKILIVEDNVDAALMLQQLLQMRGHEVMLAERAPMALDILRQKDPDIVLSDIGLPGMDGYALARAIRSEVGLRDTILVAVTGYGQAEDRRRALEAGFDEHLTKPVEFDQLDDVIDRMTR